MKFKGWNLKFERQNFQFKTLNLILLSLICTRLNSRLYIDDYIHTSIQTSIDVQIENETYQSFNDQPLAQQMCIGLQQALHFNRVQQSCCPLTRLENLPLSTPSRIMCRMEISHRNPKDRQPPRFERRAKDTRAAHHRIEFELKRFRGLFWCPCRVCCSRKRCSLVAEQMHRFDLIHGLWIRNVIRSDGNQIVRFDK